MDPEDLEVVEAQTPAIEEPISQRDEVHNDVAAAIKQLKGEVDKPAETVIEDQPEPAAKSDDRPRGPDGKFLPKEQTAAPVTAAPEVITAPDEATKPIAAPSTATVEAPGPWAADAKALWASLPPAVQAAVAKRESEMNEGGRQWSEQKRRYEQMIAPVAQEAARLGMQPDQALNALMGAHHALQQNAPAAIAALAQQYGVDLTNLASNPPAPQPQHDPMVQQLTQTVSYLENQLNGFLQNQTLGIVNQFSEGKPHYAEVEGDILKVLPLIKAENPELSPQQWLDKAYEQATWINPGVRAKLIAEQSQQAEQAKSEALKAKAQQAAKAAVSIKGSSNGAAMAPKMNQGAADESVYDTVRRSIHQLRQ